MSLVKLKVHIIFSTKHRLPLLEYRFLQKLRKHIRMNCKDKNIKLLEVNGHEDHIHCLVSLGATQTISKVAQLIKGESSSWVNHNDLISDSFYWQREYAAFSISNSEVKKVINYIRNQKQIHLKRTFDEELTALKEYHLKLKSI